MDVINGLPLSELCLIDTGSEASLLPSSIVEELELRPCNRFIMAANGSDIRLLEAVKVPIKIGTGFEVLRLMKT